MLSLSVLAKSKRFEHVTRAIRASISAKPIKLKNNRLLAIFGNNNMSLSFKQDLRPSSFAFSVDNVWTM